MKKNLFTTTLLLTCLALSPTLHAHGGAAAKHGGIVQTNHDMSFELVDGGDCAKIYISDHGKEVSAQGYSGKLTLLRGSNKTEFPLSVEGDSLKAKGAQIAKGDKVMLQINDAKQKAFSVRFSVK